jgi:streptogramin lyase
MHYNFYKGVDTTQLKPLLLAVGIAVALMLAAVGIVASAAAIEVEEADLTSGGLVYEINTDAAGRLYISDNDACEIRHVHPTTSEYTMYSVLGVADGVMDAQPDAAGDIWWTDATNTFGRVNVLSDTLTTWSLVEGLQLGGLAFDDVGHVWMTEYFGDWLYSFDPVSTEVCTYTLPGGTWSYYILYLYHEGHLWLGNWGEPSIVMFEPETDKATWWQLGDGSTPNGLAVDENGNLWWADNGLGVLARLEPEINQLTTYTLPVGTQPQMIATDGKSVWYTESFSRTVGVLDPAAAAGSTTTPFTGTGSVAYDCTTLGPGSTTPVTPITDTLSWIDNNWANIVHSGGWTVYQLPAGANPYGIAHSAGYVWVTDQGRQKLARFSPAPPEYKVYLPLVLKNMQP